MNLRIDIENEPSASEKPVKYQGSKLEPDGTLAGLACVLKFFYMYKG